MLNRGHISYPIKVTSSLWFTPLVLAAVLLAGYSSDGCGADTNGQREPANNELVLYDSITFDIKLSGELAAQPPVVTVKVIAPFSANNIPERIDKWLHSVRNYGGNVEVKPDPDYPATRDFGVIFDLINKAYNLAKEMLLYSNAENYNVAVFYKQNSGEVTKFIFTLKEGVKS
jgi:hypothetical protein